MANKIKTNDSLKTKKVICLDGVSRKITSVNDTGYNVEGQAKQIKAFCIVAHERKLHEILKPSMRDIKDTGKGYAVFVDKEKKAEIVEAKMAKLAEDNQEVKEPKETKSKQKKQKQKQQPVAEVEEVEEKPKPVITSMGNKKLCTKIANDLQATVAGILSKCDVQGHTVKLEVGCDSSSEVDYENNNLAAVFAINVIFEPIVVEEPVTEAYEIPKAVLNKVTAGLLQRHKPEVALLSEAFENASIEQGLLLTDKDDNILALVGAKNTDKGLRIILVNTETDKPQMGSVKAIINNMELYKLPESEEMDEMDDMEDMDDMDDMDDMSDGLDDDLDNASVDNLDDDDLDGDLAGADNLDDDDLDGDLDDTSSDSLDDDDLDGDLDDTSSDSLDDDGDELSDEAICDRTFDEAAKWLSTFSIQEIVDFINDSYDVPDEDLEELDDYVEDEDLAKIITFTLEVAGLEPEGDVTNLDDDEDSEGDETLDELDEELAEFDFENISE